MLTRKDMVDRLNALTLKYNLRWEDIKYDMDKALAEINFLMGTRYPAFSNKLLMDNSTYSIRIKGMQVPIIKDDYFHSVVFPYVAMEVLAREEEFTTVYSKYQEEFEKGKHKMFSNEFAFVPDYFKRNRDEGVIIPSTKHVHMKGKSYRNITNPYGDAYPNHHNKHRHLDRPEFKVIYHINNEHMIKPEHFVEDTQVYTYGELATIQGYGTAHLSVDGLTIHTFAGWSKSYLSAEGLVEAGAKVEMVDDLNLYAVWSQEYTVEVINNAIKIKSSYTDKVRNIIIPEYIGGTRVTTIDEKFSGNPNSVLTSVIIPASVKLIENGAFKGTPVESIIFTEHDITPKYPRLKIESEAFHNTPNLYNITLPYAFTTMRPDMFNQFDVDGETVLQMHRVINIRRTFNEMLRLNNISSDENDQEDIENNYFSAKDGTYTRTVNWGWGD